MRPSPHGDLRHAELLIVGRLIFMRWLARIAARERSCRCKELLVRGRFSLPEIPARRRLTSHRIKIPDHRRTPLLNSTTVRLPSVFHFGRQAVDHPTPLFRQNGGVLFTSTKLAGDEKCECDQRHTTEMILRALRMRTRKRARWGRALPGLSMRDLGKISRNRYFSRCAKNANKLIINL